MVKYNEIMNNVSVDPEMKSRIMSAVSASIKEQSAKQGKKTEPVRISEIPHGEIEAPVKKKAKKTPIVIISSIAAGILVIAGVLFVFSRMNLKGTYSAEATMANAASADRSKLYEAVAAGEMDYAEETEAAYENKSEETTNAVQSITGEYENDELEPGGNKNYTLNPNTALDSDGTAFSYRSESERMGDERLETIAGTLPFELKGTGSGEFSDTITEELFFGNGGEKVVVFTAPEGTDLVNEVFHEIYDIFHQKQYEGFDGTTPGGLPVKFYRVPFGNVTELADGETSSDVNAAVFNKNGNTYLIVFSDIQPAEVIGAVIDIW